ncbi:Cell shape-determining protein MreC [Sulfidibacter corallicola]
MAGFGFMKKYPELSLLLALELVAFLIVSYQIQVDERISLLERLSLTIVGPIQNLSNGAVGSVTQLVEDRKTLAELQEENARLRKNMEELFRVRTRLIEAEKQNQRLRDLLTLPEIESWKYVYAEVVGRTSRRDDYMIIINKGSNHGIKPDFGVSCPSGVVGVVWEVTGNYSKVMTINNPNASVAALVQESRYHESFVSGMGGALGRLENYPNFEPIGVGDLITTSGLDRLFPKNLHIGRVTSGQPSSDMFQEVRLKFSTDFSRLEEVVVLIPVPLEGPAEEAVLEVE